MQTKQKKVWKFQKIRQEGVPLTPPMVFAALGAGALMTVLGIFVSRGFLFALVMGVMCFGRFLITGSCPLLRLFRRRAGGDDSPRGYED